MIPFFAKHPTAANLLMLIFLAVGILSIRGLRRETFPDFSPTEVEIRIVYRGATPQEIEETICQRVEDALDGVKFVDELRSDARDGMAIITVEMDPKGDYQAFKDEIDTAVTSIDDFPPEVEEPVIRQLHTTELVLRLLVDGPMPLPDLKAYCEDFKERLQRQSGVSLVRIQGFSDHQFRVELSDEALRRYHLNAASMAEIIRRQSVNVPGGLIEARDGQITVRFVEERRSPQELEDLIVVAGPGGAEIRLGDIAKVTDVFELDEESIFIDHLNNGQSRAGLINIEMTKNQDVLHVAETVKQFIVKERQRYPQVNITLIWDTSTLVTDRLEMLMKNAWQGMLLVFLTMWLFFNHRLSLWVIMSLPVSFLGAFFLLPYLGLTINMMTMVGMLLALGLLMDDGIVIAENIATHRARGKAPLQAAIDGVREVKAGVFSSFITTVCVLGPLAFLDGDIGGVLEVVPMILILVLIVSLVEAFFILPAHLGHSLHHTQEERVSRFRKRFERFVDWVRESVVGRFVNLTLRWRYLCVGAAAGLFLVCIGLLVGGVLKFQAIPELEGDMIEARLLMTQGTTLEQTEAMVKKIVDGLARVNDRLTPLQPKQRPLVETVYTQFNYNLDAFENGPHVATVSVELLTAEDRSTRLDDLFAAWRKEVGKLPDVVSLSYCEPLFGPQGRSIEVRLQGKNFKHLKNAASELQNWFSRFVGVSNLGDDLRPGRPELQIRLREGAFGLGLDAQTMANQLRAAFQGVTADEIQVGNEAYEIDVRLNHKDRNSLADLDYFYFTLPNGKRVPFDAVADVEMQRAWSRIGRVNGQRTVVVRGDVDPHLSNTINLVAETKKAFLPKLKEKYPDVTISFEGEPKQAALTQGSLRRGLVIGLLGVFVLLSFQFRSYIEPLIVMVAIPLSLIGVVFGHWIMGVNLCMPSILGFISLAGIVVNDSILLVLFLKRRRNEGHDVLEAASQASRQRFRAIILTSLTTIVGLLPLLAERSLQAQVLIPLAISIAFGLMASTVLVLFVIPCLYAILNDFHLVTHVNKDER